MNERFFRALECQPADRIPFVPAIYEHKAWFVNRSPSVVCRDPELLIEAILTEYDQVRADALVVGMDVYNVEAEAVGSRVVYDDDGNAIPAIDPGGVALRQGMAITSLRIPDPLKDGRMPLMVEAARAVSSKLGDSVPVRGAVSGPFSMAANVAGAEQLFLMTVAEPERVHELLSFCAAVIGRYGDALIAAGCGVVMFDSQASPELLSPRMYRDFVLGPTRTLIEHFHQKGLRHIPLIIGGNTTKILDAYLETGANNVLCDAPADVAAFRTKCAALRRAFRRNIDTTGFLSATPEELRRETVKTLRESEGYAGFILGTGVVPYGTPLENLLAVRQTVEEFRIMKVQGQ